MSEDCKRDSIAQALNALLATVDAAHVLHRRPVVFELLQPDWLAQRAQSDTIPRLHTRPLRNRRAFGAGNLRLDPNHAAETRIEKTHYLDPSEMNTFEGTEEEQSKQRQYTTQDSSTVEGELVRDAKAL